MYGCSLLSWVWLCGCGLMWQQVVVVRLRTCHNRLLAHISVQENEAGTIAMQPATLETRQLGECALQRCPPLQTARHNVWPTATQLH